MESFFELQNCDSVKFSVPEADYCVETLIHFTLLCIILNAAMDTSMTASMVAFAVSVDSIPLPEFVSLDAKYVCIYCRLVLNMPRQLPCGHRICKLCVDKLFQHAAGRPTICCPSGDAECNNDITADQVMLFLDWHSNYIW